MTKIMVLGASSFAGASLVDFLLNKKNYLVVGTYKSKKNKLLLPFYQNQNFKKLKYIKVDIEKDKFKILKVIKLFKPTIIIDFASICMVAESWSFPMKYLKTNILNKIIFLDSFKKFKFIRKYIYISTPEVFGSSFKDKKENENRFNPSTPYAISKLSTELLFKSYAKSFNFPAIIARFSNFYGPGQPVYRLIPKAIMSVNKKIKFPLEGGGKSKRNFLFTEDFCQAILCLIKTGRPGKTYHFSGNKFFSINEVVQLICNLKKVSFKKLVKVSKDRIGKDDSYKLNCFQTKKKLNWRTKVGIKEGLIKTIMFYDQMFKKLKKEPTIFKLK